MADYNNNEQHQAKNYSFDVQKLYIEMLLADAESFARAQNIFNPNSFDRKLQPIAKFVKDYMDEYKVMPEVEIVNAEHDIKLKEAKDLDPAHFNWLLDEFETFCRHKALEQAILSSADLLAPCRLKVKGLGLFSSTNFKVSESLLNSLLLRTLKNP